MDFNLEIVFKNMPEMKSIRKFLEKEVENLDQKFEGIESCRVSFDLPYHHRYPGNIYEFQIEVVVPGHHVKVERSPSAEGSCSDIFDLIHNAFDETFRKLDAFACARESSSDPITNKGHLLTRRPEINIHL